MFGLFFSPRNEVNEDSFIPVVDIRLDIDYIPRSFLIIWLENLTATPTSIWATFVYFFFTQLTKFLKVPDITSLNLEIASEKKSFIHHKFKFL